MTGRSYDVKSSERRWKRIPLRDAFKARASHRESMNHRAVAEAFARRLKAAYGTRIDRIVLFGSVARGDYRPDSDVDLLVVTRGDRLALQEEVARDAVDVLLRDGIVVAPLVVTAAEADALAGTGLGRELAREGL